MRFLVFMLIVARSVLGASQAVDLRNVPVGVAASEVGRLVGKPVVIPSGIREGSLTLSSGGLSLDASNQVSMILQGMRVEGFSVEFGNLVGELVDLRSDSRIVKNKAAIVVIPSDRPALQDDFIRLSHVQPSTVSSLVGSGCEVRVDSRQRMVMLRGDPMALARAKFLIFELDRPLKQVFVEALITEISVSGSTETGVNLFKRITEAGNQAIAAGTSTGEGRPRNLFGVLPVTPESVTGSGSIWMSIRKVNLDVLLHFMENDSHFKVLSKPVLEIMDGESGTVVVGEDRPYVSSAISQVSTPTSYGSGQQAGSAVNSVVGSQVTFLSTAIELEVKVMIGRDGLVEMKVRQQANEYAGDVILPSGPVPMVNHRSVNTTVSVPSGGMIVLGGLTRESQGKSSNGVPGIRKVPVVGRLFEDRKRTNDRSELLVFLRVTINGESDNGKP